MPIILIGLIFSAAIGFGVVWSTQFIKRNTPAARASGVTRMKIPNSPAPKTIKIPPAALRIKTPHTSPEAAPLQSEADKGLGPTSPRETMPSAAMEPATPAPEALNAQGDAQAEPPAAENDTLTPTGTSSPVPVTTIATRNKAPYSLTPTDALAPPAPMEETTPTTAHSQKKDEASVKTVAHAAKGEGTTRQPAADDATVESKEAFNLQIGAFRALKYARNAVAKLSDRGYEPFIHEIIDGRQRTWYTVRFGRFENRTEAVLSLDQFMRNENITAIIAKAGQL